MVRLSRLSNAVSLAPTWFRPGLELLEDRLPPGNVFDWLASFIADPPSNAEPDPSTTEVCAVDPALAGEQAAVVEAPAVGVTESSGSTSAEQWHSDGDIRSDRSAAAPQETTTTRDEASRTGAQEQALTVPPLLAVP